MESTEERELRIIREYEDRGRCDGAAGHPPMDKNQLDRLPHEVAAAYCRCWQKATQDRLNASHQRTR